jgi:hypothetical protein
MYTMADEEVTTIAQDLIGRHHSHLREAHITYLFREKGWTTTCGKTVLGKAAKRTEIDKILSPREEDFIVIVSKPDWEEMDEINRKHLIDHELSHMGVIVSEDGQTLKWIIRKHDIEEFASILARYSHKQQELGELIAHPPENEIITQQPKTIRRFRMGDGSAAPERSEVE